MKYLVLGANGYIGHYLYSRMKAEGIEVIGTARDCQEKPELVNFDILNDDICNIVKLVDGKEKIAIVCIAQTNIDKCKTEYELSRKINVEATKRVVDILIQQNFHIIFFSTDNVFDGVKGNYSEQDAPNAINLYGKMKADMEHFLMEKYPEVCIFRLPKVLGVEKEKKNMLTDLENRLNDEIRCIKDMKMSIVSKEDIYQSCLIASKRQMKGIYNISNGEVWERKAIVEKFCKYMDVYEKNIIELELEKFNFMDARPLNIWLNSAKFKRETRYEFESLDTIIKQYAKKEKIIVE